MSDTAPIDDMLKRVEQMLDALDASDQSSTGFLDGCDQLERYLNDQKASLLADNALYQNRKRAAWRSSLNGWLDCKNAPKQGPIFQPDCKNILPNSRIKSHTHDAKCNGLYGQLRSGDVNDGKFYRIFTKPGHHDNRRRWCLFWFL